MSSVLTCPISVAFEPSTSLRNLFQNENGWKAQDSRAHRTLSSSGSVLHAQKIKGRLAFQAPFAAAVKRASGDRLH
ncbi:hypothetical protein BDV38DRAFT_239882, partial [Aspergillus pseudotamarii]